MNTLIMVYDEASQQNLGVRVNELAFKDLISLDVNRVMNDLEKH